MQNEVNELCVRTDEITEVETQCFDDVLALYTVLDDEVDECVECDDGGTIIVSDETDEIDYIDIEDEVELMDAGVVDAE